MKTLFLLRHANAVLSSGSLRDFDRSLTDLGRNQAECAGNYLREQNICLDLVLSSTALRARETTELVLAAFRYLSEVRYDQRIYEAGTQQLLEVVSEIDADKSKLLLVGHNPGLGELLQRLTGRLEPMAPGTLAKVDLRAAEWTRTSDEHGDLDWLVNPKEPAGG